jgi:hypothetical protein
MPTRTVAELDLEIAALGQQMWDIQRQIDAASRSG